MTESEVVGRHIEVLVLGDAMIDRSWIVTEGAETSQDHAEIVPKRVVDAKRPNVREGGAALMAAWLAWHPQLRVRLLAQMGPELRLLLEEARVDIFPDLVTSGQSTTKFRIYANRGGAGAPPLIHRYDLDILADAFPFPKLDHVDLVVIADAQKGMATEASLKALAAVAKDVPWLVDSKQPAMTDYQFFRALTKRPTLFVNRTEFVRILQGLEPIAKDFANSQSLSGRWHHIEEHVLEAAQIFHEHKDTWDLVVKLDRDGAVAFWAEDNRWRFAHVEAAAVDGAAGIGAGDAFMAGWATALLGNRTVPERLAAAVGYASAWIQVTEEMIDLTKPADVPPREQWSKERKRAWPEPSPPAPDVVAERRKQLKKNRTLDMLIEAGTIDLSLASGHCGQFMTLNPTLGRVVRYFAAEIRNFFRSRGGRRPLNCLVWAAPGSGKSFLVEEVARDVGATFCEINVSTLADRRELKHEMDAARSTDQEAVLVMIDECAAPIDNSHIFPALLAPLWSKAKTKKLAFVLVDSYPKARNVEEFATFIDSQDKGPDLLSRINGPRVTLQGLEEVDRAILVASVIRRVHTGTVFSIESTALRALVGDAHGGWSPRAIEYIIEGIVPSGSAIKYDDLRRARALCERMRVKLDNPPPGSTMVKIRDALRK